MGDSRGEQPWGTAVADSRGGTAVGDSRGGQPWGTAVGTESFPCVCNRVVL